MKKFLLAVAVLALVSAPAFAGPNAGGTLVVHNTGLLYTVDTAEYPSDAPPCDQILDMMDLDGAQMVWKVYAAFPANASPRLKALAWGTVSTPQVVASGWGLPNASLDFEITQGSWPLNGGIGESFAETKTATVNEVYWVGGYAYGPGAQSFSTGLHPTQDEVFVDDGAPAVSDPIMGFGSLGFGQPGDTPCPPDAVAGACCFGADCVMVLEDACLAQGGVWFGGECNPNPCYVPPTGACCIGLDCFVYTEADCLALGGTYRGDDVPCEPETCGPIPTETTTWGQIKANYR